MWYEGSSFTIEALVEARADPSDLFGSVYEGARTFVLRNVRIALMSLSAENISSQGFWRGT